MMIISWLQIVEVFEGEKEIKSNKNNYNNNIQYKKTTTALKKTPWDIVLDWREQIFGIDQITNLEQKT